MRLFFTLLMKFYEFRYHLKFKYLEYKYHIHCALMNERSQHKQYPLTPDECFEESKNNEE